MSKDESNIVAALRQLVKAHHATPQPHQGPRGISLVHWKAAEDALKEYDSRAIQSSPMLNSPRDQDRVAAEQDQYPEGDCAPNHYCKGRMVHLPLDELCDKCGMC